MNAAEHKIALVATAETTVVRLRGGIDKLERHLDGARDALANAEAELAAVRAADVEFVEPTEHVRTDGAGSAQTTP